MSVTETLDQAPGCPSGLEPAADAGVIDPAPFVRRTKDGAKALELSVYGAKCGGCISKIEGGLNALPGVENVRLNLSTGKLAAKYGLITPWHQKQAEAQNRLAQMKSGKGEFVLAVGVRSGRGLIQDLAVEYVKAKALMRMGYSAAPSDVAAMGYFLAGVKADGTVARKADGTAVAGMKELLVLDGPPSAAAQ